eukprot:9018623-Pyramimonas_sp.AAC.2
MRQWALRLVGRVRKCACGHCDWPGVCKSVPAGAAIGRACAKVCLRALRLAGRMTAGRCAGGPPGEAGADGVGARSQRRPPKDYHRARTQEGPLTPYINTYKPYRYPHKPYIYPHKPYITAPELKK